MKYLRVAGSMLLLSLAFQLPALAHVKWFSSYSFLHQPKPVSEIISPIFWGLQVLSVCAIGALVYLDEYVNDCTWYKQICDVLTKYADKSDVIIRAATGAVLALSWQSSSLLVPELTINNPLLEGAQLVLAALIVSNRCVKYAGYGLIGLYLFAFFQYGFLHMLDYFYLLGAGYYLVVSCNASEKTRATALPALYASVGFSLCWVAQEKLFYPEWGLEIIEANPQLAMGLNASFFLTSSAFVEFALGFLLIICMLQRPIALIITLVFMSTTLVFGKMEIIGHAIVHAALLVFFLRGAGNTFRTPVTFFKHKYQRVAFVNASFVIFFAIILASYSSAANWKYEFAQELRANDPHMQMVELEGEGVSPVVEIELVDDQNGGWNLHLLTQNFVFSPEEEGKEHIAGHGHAHLYINDVKVARLYGPWYHIKALPPGKHTIRVTLNANNHSMYTRANKPVSATQVVVNL